MTEEGLDGVNFLQSGHGNLQSVKKTKKNPTKNETHFFDISSSCDLPTTMPMVARGATVV